MQLQAPRHGSLLLALRPPGASLGLSPPQNPQNPRLPKTCIHPLPLRKAHLPGVLKLCIASYPKLSYLTLSKNMSFKKDRNRAFFLGIPVIVGKELEGEELKNFFPVYINLAFTMAEKPHKQSSCLGPVAGRAQPASVQGKFAKSAAEPMGFRHGPVTSGILWD